MLSRVMAKNVGDVYLRHSVDRNRGRTDKLTVHCLFAMSSLVKVTAQKRHGTL